MAWSRTAAGAWIRKRPELLPLPKLREGQELRFAQFPISIVIEPSEMPAMAASALAITSSGTL